MLPLADDQIREYLHHAESPALWQDISGDEDTIELARSPLLLRMLIVAYEDTAPDEWHDLAFSSQRQTHLFDGYIRRVLSTGTSGPFPKAQVVHWLGSLAQVMKDHSQSELLIEHLQPTWLQSAGQRRLYTLGVLVSGSAVLALGLVLAMWPFERFPEGPVGLEYAHVAANTRGLAALHQYDALLLTVICLAAGFVVATRQRIQPIETLVWSWTKGWQGMIGGLSRMSLIGLNRMVYLGLPVGLLVGVGMLRGSWASHRLSPELAEFSVAGYIVAGVALLALGVSMVLTLRSVWLVGRADTRARGTTHDALVSGLTLTVGAWPNMGLIFAACAGLTVGLIVRFSGGSHLLSGSRFADALLIGLIGGLGSSAISWLIQSNKSGFTSSAALLMLGGVGVAATVALFVGLANFKNPQVAAVHPPGGRVKRLAGSLLLAGILAGVCGLIVGVVRNTGGAAIVRGITVMSASLGIGWVTGLVSALMFATIAGVFGMVTGGILGALFGLLKGLTGPDIERRTVPNQGIRQSAANVSVFALAGALIIGLPYGLMNLMIAVALTGVAPGPLDWLQLTIMPAVLLGLAGGLVPGAACIQHFVLRSVLSICGLAPWRYAQFLNYATERMLLQRIGGRYRFIHDLLREHLAAMHSQSGSARKA